MKISPFKKLLVALLFVFVIRSVAHAALNIYDPNWAIETKTGYYGLQGYQSTTYIVFGSHYVFIPVSPYRIVGITAAGGLVLVSAGVRLPRQASAHSNEKRVASPCAPANPDLALRLQSTCPGRVVSRKWFSRPARVKRPD